MTEQDSLRTIEEMMRATESKEISGLRASFNLWGAACILLGLLAYGATTYFSNPWWNCLWFLLLLVKLLPASKGRSQHNHVTTYIDDAVSNLFKSLGALFLILSIVFTIVLVVKGVILFQLMAPLAVVFTGYTSMQVWSIAKKRAYFVLSIAVLVLGVFGLSMVVIDLPYYRPLYNIIFGVLFGVLFLIPGSYYNRRKSDKL